MAVNPLLADPPAASEQPSIASPPPQAGNGAVPPYGAMQPPPDPARLCKSCGANLAPGQEWCLQCGAGVPGSLAGEADWRPLAVLAAAGVLLLAGAGTAAYAALNQQASKPPTHLVIAHVPATTAGTPPGGSTLNTPPATTTPGTSTPGASTPGGSGAFGTTTRGRSTLGLPATTVKPPKLPALVPTPRITPSTVPPTNTGSNPTEANPTETTPVKTPTAGATEPTPNPILLDTNAASTYNPSGYPASYFGDPGLAIDGEKGTAWTAQVEPKVAPLMAAGLALDLKTPHHLGGLEVRTSTPGVTVEVFGANGGRIPATIVDPAWTKLGDTRVLKKKKNTLKLAASGRTFTFIVLWLTRAPAASVGTATAPGHVSIDETVLFPPVK
jgi:hypothetical protein